MYHIRFTDSVIPLATAETEAEAREVLGDLMDSFDKEMEIVTVE